MEKVLPTGKLNFHLLENLLKKYQTVLDSRLIIGPKLGEDAAVIDYPDRYLVTKLDPVTFTSKEIGWYAVQVNANDIATRGATPKWFQASILLPEGKTTKKLVERTFAQISEAAKKLGISIIGGHTEITHHLERPIVVGSMLGEVEKEKLVSTAGARPGNLIILTKGIVIEGTSIIAREKEKELKKRGYNEDFLRRCQNFLYRPGISIVKEALLANQFKISAMHDPTEGGLLAGLYEIALASGTGLLIEKEKIPIFEESKVLCKEYNLDPLGTITSGTLLIVASPDNSGKVITLLKENGIEATIIGEIKERNFGMKIIDNQEIKDLKVSARDEITKIFTKN